MYMCVHVFVYNYNIYVNKYMYICFYGHIMLQYTWTIHIYIFPYIHVYIFPYIHVYIFLYIHI